MVEKSSRYLGLVLVLLAIAWGCRLTVLEGFVLEWPRGFNGDFRALMFDGRYWDGRGIAYGPLFVIEKWLVEWLPRVFTVYFFALANVFLAAGAFVFCIRACRAGVAVVLVGLASWLCYWRLFYAFSVAANPEFLELFFLSWAWFAASRRRERSEGLLVAAAGLTKLIPWVFVVPLVLRRSVQALATLLAVAAGTVLLVAVGQRMSPAQTIFQMIVPYNGRAMPAFVGSPESGQFVGLLEALERLIYGAGERALSAEHLKTVQVLFVVIVVGALCLTVWASIRLLRRRHGDGDESCCALTYAMFFALVPVLSVAAHPHTFLFLLPVWIAFVHELWKDQGDAMTRGAFGALLASCYVLTGFPQALLVADRIFKGGLLQSWMYREPMVGNLLLLVALWGYVAVRTRTPVSQMRPARAAI